MDKKKYASNIFWAAILYISLICLDQFSKVFAKEHLSNNKPFVIIKDVFEFNYLEGGNKGAAWGLLSGHITILSIISVVMTVISICVVIRITYVLITKSLDIKTINKYNLIRVLTVFFGAGAIGNAIDRIANKYVIDFIYFKLINFPIFNIADIYVVVSTISLAIIIAFFVSDDELKVLVSDKENN